MAFPKHNPQLPPELRHWKATIEQYARSQGLDFFPVIFEMLNWEQMNMVAAYGGFPSRYPHWRFGMEYDQLAKSYEYGLSKIYEMVINNDPCYAYLLDSNSILDQKMVIAHVLGHCDFFKNNFWFSGTHRKMMDETANHAVRIQRYMNRHGVDRVENFLDHCLSLEDLIDLYNPYLDEMARKPEPGEEPPVQEIKRLRAPRSYLDAYINPKEFLDEQREKARKGAPEPFRTPPAPTRDVLGYLLMEAPLENWERDCLEIIRQEAYYFAPQRMTKIMNEGWASYWHSRIMTGCVLSDAEILDYADHHSGVMAVPPGGFNPYKIGIELFRDIEDRWNKGRFGKEYQECDDLAVRKTWDLKLGLGRAKIFEVRKHYNDITFIDEFLTEDFCRAQKLFSYTYHEDHERWEIESRDFPKVKTRLLAMLTNSGRPVISVENGNYENKGELLLRHRHDGSDLDTAYARETLAAIHAIWRRPINIATVADGKEAVLRYDGKK